MKLQLRFSPKWAFISAVFMFGLSLGIATGFFSQREYREVLILLPLIILSPISAVVNYREWKKELVK